MTYQITPPRPVAPSGPGAIAGYEAACSCGLVMRCSLETMLMRDIVEHGFWHQTVAYWMPAADTLDTRHAGMID